MTYRSKRAREILAATSKSQDPQSSQSPNTTASKLHDPLSFVSEFASKPTKKQVVQSPPGEVLKNDKWGPFSSPDTTTKCAQPPPNRLGSIGKKPPTGSILSSVKDSSCYQSKNPPQLSSRVPPNVQHSNKLNSLNNPLASSPTSHPPLQHPQPGKGGSQNLGTSVVKTSAATPISHKPLQHPQPGKGGSQKTSAATPQFNQTHQKSAETSNDITKKSKSL